MQSPASAQLIPTSVQRRGFDGLDTRTGAHTCTYIDDIPTRAHARTRVHTPDARHASGLRAKLASLQLTGNNLPLGFQLPGETFKLQLLHLKDSDGERVKIVLFTLALNSIFGSIVRAHI